MRRHHIEDVAIAEIFTPKTDGHVAGVDNRLSYYERTIVGAVKLHCFRTCRNAFDKGRGVGTEAVNGILCSIVKVIVELVINVHTFGNDYTVCNATFHGSYRHFFFLYTVRNRNSGIQCLWHNRAVQFHRYFR